MQRYIIIMCVLVFVLVSHASAQQYQDVVYLKNGSIIRGVIIEQIPGDSLKIQTEGGSVFVHRMSEVLKIAKEPTMIQTARKKGDKNPGAAVALSLLIPGGGQAYNEEYDKAAVHFVVGVVTFAMVRGGLEDNVGSIDRDGDDGAAGFAALIYLGNWIYCMVDAHKSAHRINAERRNNPRSAIIDDRLFLDPYTSRETRGAMLSLHF